MIGVIDYGMGNLYSVSKALERMNAEYFVSSDLNELEKATAYILPGVGAFKDAMAILTETKTDKFLKDEVQKGKALLGICLGMQLLFNESEEHGWTEGLGFLNGQVKRIPGKNVKVPHMGWNKLTFQRDHPLITGLQEDYVYFVHSYYAVVNDPDVVVASASYGVTVPAIVGSGNVFGCQFHPEKSGKLGLAILKNYLTFVSRM
ncbi:MULTISPECIES: imidazole glycerol phosphate synthase subunit HisH [Aeribacillus]|uniref:Imidazole glycerol phosphate synthase subunit HisH n=1 Tax=Aeribacillus pallidus TaxID=33936 RepID=A0A223E565_9BACI|nr:imidazole glycerol phosphate synthase subunit HisH [Aeribacillus pallidus]ASS90275.1 imidazole glycerol phosphate synthase, glutamine amidotransferase subunit [Aeribacillus pallidus]